MHLFLQHNVIVFFILKGSKNRDDTPLDGIDLDGGEIGISRSIQAFNQPRSHPQTLPAETRSAKASTPKSLPNHYSPLSHSHRPTTDFHTYHNQMTTFEVAAKIHNFDGCYCYDD
jgi:hypothetical protein